MRATLLWPWIGAALVVGCQGESEGEAGPVREIRNFAVGPWVNRYADSPDLAGVRVQQFPDCDGEAPRYEGRHPAMLIYVFKDGRANQVSYEPDGTVTNDFWFKVAKDHWIWQTMTPVSSTEPAEPKN